MSPQPVVDATSSLALRRELLRVVLRDTLRNTGVPMQWIGGEATPATDEHGRSSIEVRLILECDEPRFLYYLGAFQEEFEARLLAVDPQAWGWVSRVSWGIRPQKEAWDPDFAMPTSDYWEHVVRDRELLARQQGRLAWDPDALARHFESTQPGEPDFENTHPPALGLEDVQRAEG